MSELKINLKKWQKIEIWEEEEKNSWRLNDSFGFFYFLFIAALICFIGFIKTRLDIR